MARVVACGIDIGTHHVKVMVCKRVEENGRIIPKIIATGQSEARGLRHGYIVNTAEITSAIEEALAQVRKSTELEIKNAFLAIGGVGLSAYSNQASVIVSRADGEVTDLDVAKAQQACEDTLPSQYTLNRQILHPVPVSFKLDGRPVLSRPQGLRGSKLEAKVLYVTCVEQHLNDLVEAVNNAGLNVEDVMAAPLSASLITLTNAQKIAGCVLVNIGAETTSIVVFENSTPVSLEVFPIGGMDITHDIALGMRIPLEEAELIKKGKEHQMTKRKVAEIIEARLSDIFELIAEHLNKIGKGGLLPAGIILTGGSSGIAEITDIAKTTLKLPARTAKNIHMKDDKGLMRDSIWSVAYGLCLFGINQKVADGFGGRTIGPLKNGALNVLKQISDWFKRFMP